MTTPRSTSPHNARAPQPSSAPAGPGRRTFLTALGALATTTALGVPAYASEAARDAATATEYIDVQLLNISDLHGYLQGPTGSDSVIRGNGGKTYTVGGVAAMGTHLERLREGRRNSLFFAPGDLFSGWEFDAAAFSDEPTIEALNRLGMDFATAGNHEFDKSPAHLVQHMERGRPFPVVGQDTGFPDSTGRRFRGADFPYYSANVVRTRGGRTVLPPYHVEWVRGPHGRRIPIGFIHLTVVGAELMPNSFHPGLKTLDDIGTVDRCAKELKRRGVNAIVLSMHDGAVAGADFNSGSNPSGPAYELALKVSPDIDAIVTGHWHTRFNMMLPDPNGVPRPFVEAGFHGQVINEINLRLDPRTGRVVRELTVSTSHPNTRDVTPHPGLKAVADYWAGQAAVRERSRIGGTSAPLTRTRNALGQSTMGDLAADWLLWAARRPVPSYDDSNIHRYAPADLALAPIAPKVGQSFVRGDLIPAAGSDGAVSFGQAWRAIGYGCPTVCATVTGQQVHDALEQQWSTGPDGVLRFAPLAVSGNVRYAFDAAGAVGDRVDPSDVRIDGAPLRLDRDYRVAAASYTFLGMDGFPALSTYREPYRHPRDFESFIAHVRDRRMLKPSALDRVTAKNAGLRGAAAAAGRITDPPTPVREDGSPLPAAVAAILTAGGPHARLHGGHRPPC
ncbi:bifunctional metallophosphatase/5'-nucleotidase [Streptomyces sp. NPDC021093]|uniref:bifunctional metallophosphatase/5'-nucleotidase n=1 Tax=Streptomyces sp. NPDC021093 TaxID=3365112 RepID=UPI0037A6C75B